MEVQSLELKTDLHISKFSDTVTDRGEYIVVHTPSNPGYYFAITLSLTNHQEKMILINGWLCLKKRSMIKTIPTISFSDGIRLHYQK